MMRKYWCLMLLVVVLFSAVAAHAAAPARILFDQGHNQRFVIEDSGELQLSKLAGVMRGQGAQVTAVSVPLTDTVLSAADAVVISGPFEALKPLEVESLTRFVQNGGRLALMLHIGSPFDGLLERLGVDRTNMVLHEQANVIDNDQNFRVKDLAQAPLMAGLTGFSAYGVWGVNPGDKGRGLAATSNTAWVDMNGDRVLSRGDLVGRFDVVVSGTLGKGRFVVFGDDAIFQNRYLDEDNLKLAGNLAAWLAQP